MHARQTVAAGSKYLIIKANDTDVLIISVSVLPSLQNLGLQKLWIFFGVGAKLRWIPIHDMTIGSDKSKGMIFFHAFTGCDVVSAFHGKGKQISLADMEHVPRGHQNLC